MEHRIRIERAAAFSASPYKEAGAEARGRDTAGKERDADAEARGSDTAGTEREADAEARGSETAGTEDVRGEARGRDIPGTDREGTTERRNDLQRDAREIERGSFAAKEDQFRSRKLRSPRRIVRGTRENCERTESERAASFSGGCSGSYRSPTKQVFPVHYRESKEHFKRMGGSRPCTPRTWTRRP